MKIKRAVNLAVDELPKRWYNILADIGADFPPPKDPPKGESRIANLPKILLAECLKQEMSTERWIDIPEELQQLYLQAARPRPLFRAINVSGHGFMDIPGYREVLKLK